MGVDELGADGATRLLVVMEALHWSRMDVARAAGYNEKQVRRWVARAAPVPGVILDWLENLARYHVAHPSPRLIGGVGGDDADGDVGVMDVTAR